MTNKSPPASLCLGASAQQREAVHTVGFCRGYAGALLGSGKDTEFTANSEAAAGLSWPPA